jgi:hypothetical protein
MGANVRGAYLRRMSEHRPHESFNPEIAKSQSLNPEILKSCNSTIILIPIQWSMAALRICHTRRD